MDCLFCKIISGEIPSSKVYETDSVFAFDDINPQTPVHVLVIPKIHVENLNDIDETNSGMIQDLFLAIRKIVKLKGIEDSGYRVLANTGSAAHQEVYHLHFHIFGGKDKLGPMILRS